MAVLSAGPQASQRRSLFFPLAVVFAGFIGVFALPWFIPFRQPVSSLSYTYGFNNFAAWVAVALLLAVACILQLLNRNPLASFPAHRLSSLLADAGSSHRRLKVAFAAVAISGAALQILCYTLLPSNDFGEIGQHTERLDLMLLGQRPHVDFNYVFGPGMLYAVYGLYRLGAGIFSIDTAYSATLVADWILGCFLLYYVVGNLSNTVKKTTVFLCISALFFNPTMMGLQYTPLRYFLPLAALLFVHRSVLRNPGAFALVMISAFVLPLAALAFSPDAGIATTAALLIYFATLLRTSVRKFSWGLAACGLAIAAGFLLFGRDYLDTITSHSNSAFSFPVFPSVAVVALLAAALLFLPSFVSASLHGNTPADSLLLGAVVALGLGIPAALGRCDLVHISFNGAGILLLSVAALTMIANTRLYRTALCGYVLVFPFATLAGMMGHSYGHVALQFVRQRILHTSQSPPPAPITDTAQADTAPSITWPPGFSIDGLNRAAYSKPKSFSPDLAVLLGYERVGIPLGAPEDVRRFLKITGRFVPEYWPWVLSYLGTEADISRKLQDLETMPVILVPREVFLVDNFMTVAVTPELQSPTTIDPVLHRENAEHILTPLTFFPVRLPMARNVPVLPEMRILATIARNYRPAGQFRNFIIAVKASR